MQQVEQMLDEVIFNLKLNQFESNQHVTTLSKRFNVNAHQVLRIGVGAIGVLSIFFIWLFAHKSLYFFFNVILPAFLTVTTVVNEDAFSRNGKLYLSYWVCAAFIGIVDYYFGFLFRIIPFAKLARCVFCIWLYSAKTRGAELINRVAFHPFVAAIENFFGKGTRIGGTATPSAEKISQ